MPKVWQVYDQKKGKTTVELYQWTDTKGSQTNSFEQIKAKDPSIVLIID